MSCPYKGTRLPPLLSATSPALLHSGVSIPVTPRFPPRLTSRHAGVFFVVFFPSLRLHFSAQPPPPTNPLIPFSSAHLKRQRRPPLAATVGTGGACSQWAAGLTGSLLPTKRRNYSAVSVRAAYAYLPCPPPSSHRRLHSSRLHSSRLHVAPVQTAREGRFSVNGVVSLTLRVALRYFHDGTRAAGAGMKPKPFAAHLQTFYAFRSNPRGTVLLRPSSKSGEGKLSVPSPPIISFSRLCAADSFFIFFFLHQDGVSVLALLRPHTSRQQSPLLAWTDVAFSLRKMPPRVSRGGNLKTPNCSFQDDLAALFSD